MMEVYDVFVWLLMRCSKYIWYKVLRFVFEQERLREDHNSLSVSSVAVMISPFVFLMINQVISLHEQGVAAAIVSSNDLVVLLPKQSAWTLNLAMYYYCRTLKQFCWRQFMYITCIQNVNDMFKVYSEYSQWPLCDIPVSLECCNEKQNCWCCWRAPLKGSYHTGSQAKQ